MLPRKKLVGSAVFLIFVRPLVFIDPACAENHVGVCSHPHKAHNTLPAGILEIEILKKTLITLQEFEPNFKFQICFISNLSRD